MPGPSQLPDTAGDSKVSAAPVWTRPCPVWPIGPWPRPSAKLGPTAARYRREVTVRVGDIRLHEPLSEIPGRFRPPLTVPAATSDQTFTQSVPDPELLTSGRYLGPMPGRRT